jgi:hypothetical protein
MDHGWGMYDVAVGLATKPMQRRATSQKAHNIHLRRGPPGAGEGACDASGAARLRCPQQQPLFDKLTRTARSGTTTNGSTLYEVVAVFSFCAFIASAEVDLDDGIHSAGVDEGQARTNAPAARRSRMQCRLCARGGGRAPPRTRLAVLRSGVPTSSGLRGAAGPGRRRRRGAAAQVPCYNPLL